jgi:hypothetical protein
MKTFICLLFPFLIFAQNPFPDTLLLTDGRTYPCLITSIDDTKVEFLYLNNKSESLVLKAVDQLSIEELGAVYSTSQGFTKNVEQVDEFVNDRLEKMTDEQLVQQELAKLTAVSNSEQMGDADSTELAEYFEYQKPFQMKKWSFGVLLIPYYSGRIYSVIQYGGQNPPEIYINSFTNNEINMQGQLSYGILSNIMVTLDVAYSSSYSEYSSEYHSRNEYDPYDSGLKETDGLYLFDFTLGLKYYFLEFFPNNVNIYALLGLGQQFASAEVTDEDLYPGPEPIPIIEDNMAEYLEGMNSPWHLDFGFGVEYLFNESISLNSNIRFIYNSISSEYDYRYIYENETASRTIEYSNSEFITRIGLGLNFYF